LSSKQVLNLPYPLPCSSDYISKVKLDDRYRENLFTYRNSQTQFLSIKAYLDNLLSEIELAKSSKPEDSQILYNYIILSYLSPQILSSKVAGI
jgi:hypothetical protein